jgi:hypothetical protein
MRPFFLLFLLCFSILWKVKAQDLLVEVSTNQTTYLVFDYAIASVDRGTNLLLSEQDLVAKNMLKLKATDETLNRTNLHVLTADGTLHDFQIQYAPLPIRTTYDLRQGKAGLQSHSISESAVFEYGFSKPQFLSLAAQLKQSHSKIIKKTSIHEMNFLLTGIYQSNGLLFFQIWVENVSSIPYLIRDLKLTVVDQKTKSKSSQNINVLKPVFSEIDQDEIYLHGKGKYFLIAVPTFAISDRKKLALRLTERTGDRELNLSIKGKAILKAKALPNFHLNTISYGSGEL